MKQIVPNKTQLRRYLQQGLTQQQIVAEWEAETGIKVSRSAIAMAIGRYELKPKNTRPRYDETIPWEVRTEHQNDHNARMLRLEGKRRQNKKLTEQEQRWLDGYIQKLKDRDAVVYYNPELPEGFVWLRRDKTDEDIVRRELRPAKKKASA